ncbi:MAG: succinate dehydrogenase [Deltaproteobacteria bacterium]|nr:MAG: succinate dehydrogenase [Deltaproteobacteria bacterium]
MGWLTDTLGTSIGKKIMMAVTGLGFIFFLLAHLAGNLTIYGGGDTFNAYAEHLHSLGPLIHLAEVGLLSMALIHVITGGILFFQNRRARTSRYVVNARAGGRTIGSRTMPYTGLIILLFIVFHLVQFHFTDKTDTTIFEIVSTAFSNPFYVALYTAVMVVLAIHISHGFWSLFQTLGASHPKYSPVIFIIGICLSILFGAGFGILPIYVAFI